MGFEAGVLVGLTVGIPIGLFSGLLFAGCCFWLVTKIAVLWAGHGEK
jgi:hypothetical protein